MTDENTVMIDGKPFHISPNEVMAIINGKLSDEIKGEVLKACPHIRGPVARIQFLVQNQSTSSSVFSAETSKEAKTLVKTINSELRMMSASYDRVETKLEDLMNDNQAKELIDLMTKEG